MADKIAELQRQLEMNQNNSPVTTDAQISNEP